MSAKEAIRLEVDRRGVASLVLARPDKHNALSAPMMEELTQAAEKLGRNPAVRVVVLRAEGESFCAGGDLEWMRQQMRADGATRAREATKLARMLYVLNEMPKPLIGCVQGNAFGGGLGMVAVCDVAIGADSARFALTETRLGLIPATIGPYVIARMGEARARRVFMSGRQFDASEAERLGLLAAVTPGEELEAAVLETANTIGLPLYARQHLDEKGRWIDLMTEASILPVNKRPRLAVRLHSSN